MENKNQFKIGIFLSYIAIFLRIIIQLGYTPFMLRQLGQNEYGLYQLANSVISYLSLFSLGFGGAYVRFYFRYKADDDLEGIAKLNGLFLIVFSVLSCIAVLAGLVLVKETHAIFRKSLTPQEIEITQLLMKVLVFNLALSFPASIFQNFITAKEQFVWQRGLNLLTILFNPFLSIILLFMGYKAVALVVATTIVSLFSFTINIWFCLGKLRMRFSFKQISPQLLKEIALFSFFIFLNSIIDQINWSVDKFLLGMYVGSASIAVYSLGAVINNLYLQFSTSISSVFGPQVNRIVSTSNDNHELTVVFTRIGRLQYLVLMLILTGFIFVGKPFTLLWAGKDYVQSYYVALLLLIPVTIPLIQNLGIEIQRAKNMHQFRSYVYLAIALFNICLSIPLCQKYGAIGSAIGTAISLILGNGLIMNWYYDKKIGLDICYFWKEILILSKGLIVPITFGCLINYYYVIETWKYLFCWGLVYVTIYSLSMYLFGIQAQEQQKIKRNVKKMYHKVFKKKTYK